MRKVFPLFVVLGLVLAACQPTASESPSPSEAPAESAAPFSPISYPPGGPQDCAYGGEFSEIAAVDELTVQFTLCYSDPAFLSKIAFTAFAIADTADLENNMENHLILAAPNGTGPYSLTQWQRGIQLVLDKNPDYWGTNVGADQLVFRWSTESAARLLELQAGTVDGIDNPAPNDFATIEGDAALQLIDREALNTFYVGFNENYEPFDDVRVRQALAMGIDRQRIVDQFFPEGSVTASHFTPCAIPLGCEGDEWYEFDLEGARDLLAEAGLANGFSTVLNYRDVVRGYLPDPNIVAQDLQAQLSENLNIDVAIDVQESGTFLDNATAGALSGLYLLGWGADYPDPTNFLDYHFNNVANHQFGDIEPSVTEPLTTAGTTLDTEVRAAAYVEANNAIKETVPMVPISHGASATAWKADVTGAHASPLGNESFAHVTPGDRAQMVWMQNAEPIALYCADETDGETLRLCEQITEPLYVYEVGGVAPIPALAENCAGNEDATSFTCTLRSGVTFHNGAAFDANDVVLSYAVQWDMAHPLHIGRTGSFEYFAGFFANFLNVPE
ncbi:MAG: ABC transporter substrate-binding protein [Candidatus Limnocylindria bacterium]